MEKEMCPRYNFCLINGEGCTYDGANHCDLFKYINQRLLKIKKVLNLKKKISYQAKWYSELKQDLLKVIDEREFINKENRIVDEFLQRQLSKKGQ